MADLASNAKFWDPSRYLRRETHPYTVIVLNQPIENVSCFSFICHRASQIVAADGGANHIFDLHQSSQLESRIHPHYIIGDFDSIRPEVKDFYKGTRFIHRPDVVLPDFAKCLDFVAEDHRRREASKFWSVVAFGSLAGRADQAFAQIHQLYWADQNPQYNPGDVFLFTPSSIIFVLKKGKNVIKTPVQPGFLDESVGIIPIANPAVLTLKGFEWDVEDWHTSFGTQMSTSQHIKSEEVVVVTSGRVLFTVELDKTDKQLEVG